MTEVVQPTDLKIGIDGVAKPVTHVISEVEKLQAERAKLVDQIKKVEADDADELERLQLKLRLVDFRIDHYQDHLDIQFPNYPPSPNK